MFIEDRIEQIVIALLNIVRIGEFSMAFSPDNVRRFFNIPSLASKQPHVI
jgi:hypothetical protein